MNRVFVSLRQACCRDAGTLGTPCRLKIMELVELRAMGWRPSLSHSQYYLNRHSGSGGAAPPSNMPQPPHTVYAAPNAQNHGNPINMGVLANSFSLYIFWWKLCLLKILSSGVGRICLTICPIYSKHDADNHSLRNDTSNGTTTATTSARY
jgi:hypothetical protein